MLNYPKQYKGDILNKAFAVELFIEIKKPDYCIYGNTYFNTENFNIENTVITI